MSGATLLGVSLLYAFPLALLAMLLTAEWRRPRWLVTAVLGALPLFYIGHYEMLEAVQGWPSDAAVPGEFRLLAFDVREPDPRADREGEILLWLRDAAGGQARVHRLGYRKELHEALIAAGRLQAEGSPQIGRRTTPPTTAGAGAPDRSTEAISFRKEQPPALPAKDAAD